MKNHEMFSISSFSSTTEKYFGMHSLSQNCMIRPILNSPLNNWVCSIIGYLGFLYFCEAMQKARNFGAFRIACWVHFCRNENEAISSANRLSSLQGPGKLHGKQTTPNWFEKGNAFLRLHATFLTGKLGFECWFWQDGALEVRIAAGGHGCAVGVTDLGCARHKMHAGIRSVGRKIYPLALFRA